MGILLTLETFSPLPTRGDGDGDAYDGDAYDGIDECATGNDGCGWCSAVAVSGLVGIVFGLYLARKASRLDPIAALRFE